MRFGISMIKDQGAIHEKAKNTDNYKEIKKPKKTGYNKFSHLSNAL